MEIRSVLTPTREPALLFDDRLLLETALGKNVWAASAPRTDCDCISHANTFAYEDAHTHQVPSVAGRLS